MPAEAREPGWLRRTARLLIGRSALRRPSDRIEGAVLALLSAAFLACAATAGFLGWRWCEAQSKEAAHLHPAVAVVTRTVPAVPDGFPVTEAAARWRAPGGQQRSGILTTSTAPGVWGTQAGERVRVWLTASGDPAPAPPGTFTTVVNTVVIAAGAWAGAGLVLGVCYVLSRLVLDRRRLAGWESDWAMTEPRWTTRR
jgi:hypothetical protein